MRKNTNATKQAHGKRQPWLVHYLTPQNGKGRILAGVLALTMLSACDDNERTVFVPVDPEPPVAEIVNYNQYDRDHATAHEITIDFDALNIENPEVLVGFPLEVSVTALGIDISNENDTQKEDYAAFYAQLIPADASTFSVASPLHKIGTFHFEDNDPNNRSDDNGWNPVITQHFRLDLNDNIPAGDYRLVVMSAHAHAAAQHDEQFSNQGGLSAANLGLSSLSDLPSVTIAANTNNTYDIELQASHSQSNIVAFNVADPNEVDMLIPVVIEHYMWGDIAQTPLANVALEAQIQGSWQPLELLIETPDNVLSDKFHEVLNTNPFKTDSDTSETSAQRQNQGLAGKFTAQQQQELLAQANNSNLTILNIPLRLTLQDINNDDFTDHNLNNNQVDLENILVFPQNQAVAGANTPAIQALTQPELALEQPVLAPMDSPFSEGDHSIFNNNFSKEYMIDTDIIDLDLASISETTDVNYSIGAANKPSVIFNANSSITFEVLGTGNVEALDATLEFQAGLLQTNGWNIQIGGQIPEFDDNGLKLKNGQLVLEHFRLFSSERSVDIAFDETFDWKVSRDLTLAQKSIPVGVIPINLAAGTNGEINSTLELSGNDSKLNLNGKPINSDVGGWLTVGINLNQNLVNIDSIIDLDVNLILDAGFTASVTLLDAFVDIDNVGYTYNDSSNTWDANGELNTEVNLIEAELDVTVQVGAEVDIDAGILGSSDDTYYVVNEDNVQVASTDGFLLSPVADKHTF